MNYEELGRRLREAVIGMSDEDFFDSLARAGIELEDAEPQFFALDNHSWILISSDCAVVELPEDSKSVWTSDIQGAA